ncbi:MAG TPA: translation initiation factor IF-2 [Candidatus Dojkabacteria bacterium]|nr:translation initiation factor IF-2 [Candidatus Dojkabacteria bacterium]HQF36348.1 translation initiation factor IF-2 [Candidatus Dojkabacteria bacterium]
MGHVDHGKTTILDKLRETSVWSTEVAGITQHISWSLFNYKGKDITFIDTPGHQAFQIMRQIGGKIADIVLLIIAADDGLQPQTVEAINIIKDHNVDFIVVVNKIDLPGANPDRIKQQLSEYEILVEGWGGNVPIVEVSGKTGQGLDTLMETIAVLAEMKELKYSNEDYGVGVVLDSWVSKSLGKCIDLLVIKGTIKRGFSIKGSDKKEIDRIGVIFDNQSKMVKEVGEGYGARIIGLENSPETGSIIVGVENPKDIEKTSTIINELPYKKCQLTCLIDNDEAQGPLESFEQLFTEDNRIVIPLIVKADTQGVLDAIFFEIKKLGKEYPDVNISIIHSGVGPILMRDLDIARTANDIKIIAFNTNTEPQTQKKAKELGLTIKQYDLIYTMIEDLQKYITKTIQPEFVKESLGKATVKQVFVLSDGSIVAGSIVTEGKITKGNDLDIMRGEEVISTTKVDSLRIMKEKVTTVSKGSECGIAITEKVDIKEGDIISAFKVIKSTNL